MLALSIIGLIIIGILLIIDAWRNNWAATKFIGQIASNVIWPRLRIVLGILLGFLITIGSLFIISTIGLILQAKYPDNQALTWITVIPIAIAGAVLYVLMYSITALELFIRGVIKFIFGTLGGFTIPDKNWSKGWQRGAIGGLFWLYVLLALYPAFNPWTGSNMEVIWYVMSIGAVYTLLAKYFGISKYITKIFASIMILPLLFYALGKQQPDKYPLAASVVGAIESKTNLGTAGRNKETAIRGQQTDFENDAKNRLESIKVGTLKSGIKPLDGKANPVADNDDFGAKPYKVKLNKTINAIADLPTAELRDYFKDETEFFYEIKFLDQNGYYSGKSEKAYVTTNAIKGIIDVPERPEINDPNQKAKNPKNPSANKSRGGNNIVRRPRWIVLHGQYWDIEPRRNLEPYNSTIYARNRGSFCNELIMTTDKVRVLLKPGHNLDPKVLRLLEWQFIGMPNKGISNVLAVYPYISANQAVSPLETAFVHMSLTEKKAHPDIKWYVQKQ